jgi:hypothetical protein
MIDSFIVRGVALLKWYTKAIFYRGVEAVANLTVIPRYLTFLTTSFDTVLTPSGTLSQPAPKVGQTARQYAAGLLTVGNKGCARSRQGVHCLKQGVLQRA